MNPLSMKLEQTFLFHIIVFLMVIYPLLFVRQGLDFTDMGFWLSNYNLIFTHPHQVVHGFLCYLSEIIGGVWLVLFGWAGVIGIKLGYVLVLYITIFCVYQVLKDFFNKTHVVLMLFTALVFITKAFTNWVSYNDLTALFYVLSGLFLYRSINDRRRVSCFLAGFMIAACVFVRIPNILAVFLLLLPVYYDLRIKNFGRETFADYGFRGLGFLSGLAGVTGLMLLCGHLEIYINSLVDIFNRASSPGDNHSGAHLFELLTNDSVATFKIGGVILLFYLCGILVCFLFRFINGNILRALLGIAAGSLCYYFAPEIKPVFKTWFEFRVFEFTGVLYILLLVFLLWSIFRRGREKEEFLILLSIFILLMVPLGSGNGIRNAVFGMWFAIPVAGCLLFRIDNIRIANIAAVTIILIYSVTTAWEYTYRDSSERMDMTFKVTHPKLRGVLTTEKRAEAVQQLLDVLPEYVKKGDFLFAVENIPLLYYLTDTVPYFSSSWPLSLGYSDDKFKIALEKAEKEMDLPPIFVKAKVNTRSFSWPEMGTSFGLPFSDRYKNKREMLNTFVEKYHYKKVWENSSFEIWKSDKGASVENTKFYRHNYDLSDYREICSQFNGREYNISFNELKPGKAIRNGFGPLPFLTLQGIRGDFSYAVIEDGVANIMRVKLDPSDELTDQEKAVKKVVQFGPTKGKKGFDFDADKAEFCGLLVRARVIDGVKLQVFIQEKKDGSWHRIKTIKEYSDEEWHDYVVFKKIPANISKMTCGIVWHPESEDSVLDILSIRCFVTF